VCKKGELQKKKTKNGNDRGAELPSRRIQYGQLDFAG
jgi:hypothetical protein